MTKKEIVKQISEEIELTQLKTKEIVQKTFDAIIDALVEEGRIELRNFGVFAVKRRKARKARNPRTGDKVDVPEKFVVTFKPGKEMEEKVREMERRAHEEARAKAAEAQQTAEKAVPTLHADSGTPPLTQQPGSLSHAASTSDGSAPAAGQSRQEPHSTGSGYGNSQNSSS
ncbi:MAG: integration host factor subunit beta [Pirellulales bacterium]|nr:integration host factor subunit beta [Pirellulales bacterium]